VTLSETKTKNRHTFTATIHDKTQATNAWNAMYDRVSDGVVVINPHGLIQYVNTATTIIFGQKDSDLIGQNVKKLMPSEDASRHDGYLRNYRRSGVAKVIGTGRRVVGQSASGQMIPLQLTLVEQRHEGDERFFIGMLRVLDADASPLRTMLQVERETIEALSAPAIIIDSQATIVGLNAKVEQMFGYKYVELINKNVNMLMPPDIASKHDSYVSNYLKTGKSAM
jgi:PAS domain S-box-containing protein